MANLIEIVPLIMFFIAYKLVGIKGATLTIMISSLAVLLISVLMKKKLSLLSIISSVILVICGSLALAADDPVFIKMKPTMVYCIFMLCFLFYGKTLLKDMMQSFIGVDDHIWRVLSICWSLFFLFCAIMNEAIWRNFPEELWVNFKVIFMPLISFVFIAAQIIILRQYYCKSGRSYE